MGHGLTVEECVHRFGPATHVLVSVQVVDRVADENHHAFVGMGIALIDRACIFQPSPRRASRLLPQLVVALVLLGRWMSSVPYVAGGRYPRLLGVSCCTSLLHGCAWS